MSFKVKILEFVEIKKTLDATGGGPLESIVKKPCVVYVAMISREGCPSCQEQKPLFEKMSGRMKKKYADQIEFLTVHSSYTREKKEEAKQCLDAFHTAGFPTYTIAVRDNEGNTLETYRSLDAPISEIERNIKIGITILNLIRERSKTRT